MRFYLLSDNVDTLVGMRLVGIEGVVIHTKDEVLKNLNELTKNDEIAILLITTKLIKLCPEVISELKLRQTKPLIVEIPDRHGESNIGESINRYVSEAIGFKI
ncbi:cation exporting V-type ATPase, subunit F [Alteracholeplasma palmae J233]|uniref:Cation exporting V-type ATPase, subunit F n=1 Tax=Alteracholeplasma palmae (strain ATCC 49389 / J233) TaxID=1318466 RepID=U4KKB2_ALTPJ|nr:V-type ATP synthase subunit F [Alteracholeplasma palmae]CCV64007.1 cation exporting V-type ATPase, subunit F [Alteracholeplasma palmae J233]